MRILSKMEAYANSEFYSSKDTDSFSKFTAWCNEKEIIHTKITNIIPQGLRMLDIGAGNGFLTKLFIGDFKEIVAIEPSKNLFSQLSSSGMPAIKPINTKLEDFFEESKYDLIMAVYSLQYLSNLEKQIGKIKSLLKKEGKFIIVNGLRKGRYSEFLDTFWKEIHTNIHEEHFQDALFNMLIRGGFTVKKDFSTATLKIPSVHEAMKMIDFFFDKNEKDISAELKHRIEDYLKSKLTEPLIFDVNQLYFVCSI